MKLPRDVSGEDLAKQLNRLGYNISRQTGSHMRLIRIGDVEHRVTIPAHGTLKIGTLNSILKDIAGPLAISKDKLVQQLWGTGE